MLLPVFLASNFRIACDVPIPISTKNPVKNRPKSATELPELSIKSSGFAHRAQIQLGRGATT